MRTTRRSNETAKPTRPPRSKSFWVIRPISSDTDASPASWTVNPGVRAAAATSRRLATLSVASFTSPASTVGTRVARRSADTIDGSCTWYQVTAATTTSGPSACSAAWRLSTELRNAGSSTVADVDDTTNSSVSLAGLTCAASVAARVDSGSPVRLISVVSALPRRSAMTTPPTRTAATHSRIVRPGLRALAPANDPVIPPPPRGRRCDRPLLDPQETGRTAAVGPAPGQKLRRAVADVVSRKYGSRGASAPRDPLRPGACSE